MKAAHWILSTAVLAGAGLGMARVVMAQDAARKAPSVAGDWKGTWQDYKPAPAAKAGEEPKPSKPKFPPMGLDCKVTATGEGKYEAVFEGDCGRPYKYKIKMQGRQVGSAVLFSGTADLGPMDGGVYDWIGRANDKEFIGFYTSQGHTGNFSLSRPVEAK